MSAQLCETIKPGLVRGPPPVLTTGRGVRLTSPRGRHKSHEGEVRLPLGLPAGARLLEQSFNLRLGPMLSVTVQKGEAKAHQLPRLLCRGDAALFRDSGPFPLSG